MRCFGNFNFAISDFLACLQFWGLPLVVCHTSKYKTNTRASMNAYLIPGVYERIYQVPGVLFAHNPRALL